MRDAERRLLRCIGGIDDELILEADYMRFHPKRWGHLLALAACLVLVLTIPVFLNSGEAGPEAVPGYEQAEVPENNNKLAAGTEGPELDGGSYDLSLGGVKLGMTEEEVTAILGEPMDQENGWMNYNGISIEISQFLPQVVTMDLRNGSLTLPTGIGPGSTEAELLAAYPELEQNDTHEGLLLYSLEQPEQCMTVAVQNGQVVRVIVEQLGDLMYDALTVNEITIYQWADDQWQTTQVIDKAAKYICTVLTISEPEEATGEKSGVSMWMDFGNGTAVELQGNDRAAVWTYSGDTFDPNKTDGLTWHLTGVFQGLDDYVAQALENPTETWDDSPISEPTYNTDPIVATESIAGLKLGMSDREVRDILGKPYQTVSLDHNDCLLEMWLYDGISLVMFSLGDGWFLNEIYPSESSYTLSSGIGIGSTAEEVEAAYPGIVGQEDLVWDYVYSTNEDLNGLYIAMSDGHVSSIMFGPWVLDFVMESAPEESPAEEPESEP